ncbi:hypothetical protein OEA41_004526 [Lepraria neglecta]|uniref:Uncharacterized protein n=1 Tax=Lepraria neglecta TaxID=209136 RepID=A0AAD9YY04_9LECA|nr:hypothetical protein OEA41_004526 [Lepraria neglecta]
MHVFGCVYADLDTECLLPYDSMFERYNTSTAPHIELSLPSDASKTSKGQGEKSSQANDKTSLKLRGKPSFATQERKAFLGRMGTDEDFPHSIPNAWMASTPSHPFWLLPLESIKDNIYSGKEPEYLTGPTALYERVKQYGEYDGGEGNKMDEQYAKGPWRHLFKTSAQKQLMAPPQSMNMKHTSGSDDNTIETKGKEAEDKEEDKGDANEWKKQAKEWKKTQEERKKKQEARKKEQE